jgi:energy-coupling factor transporter transmembrane protein EcfT
MSYTGYGLIIFFLIGIIIMFIFLRGEYNSKLSDVSNYSKSKEDYTNNLINYSEFGWLSKYKDEENIYAIILFLVGAIFFGFISNGIGFQAIPLILILSIEYFILKRYYLKKLIVEIEALKEV